MPSLQYHFRSTWRLAAPPVAVFAVLAALDDYPSWWPQVRRAEPLDSATCAITIRSVLPLALRVVAHHERRDPHELILQARLTGDLYGHSCWTLRAQTPGTVALFEEHVELRRRVLALSRGCARRCWSTTP